MGVGGLYELPRDWPAAPGWTGWVRRGLSFPDGSARPGPCSLVLNAEDGAADTIRPWLAALGADLGRVFVLERPREGLSFPSQLAVLEEAIARTGALLVVIDTLLA